MKKLSVMKAVELIEGRRDQYIRMVSNLRRAGCAQMANEMLIRADECDCALSMLRNYGKPIQKLTIPKDITVAAELWPTKKSRKDRL